MTAGAPTMRVAMILTAPPDADADRSAPDFAHACEEAALDTSLALCVRLKTPLTVLALGATDTHKQRLRWALERGCARAVALTWPNDSAEDAADDSAGDRENSRGDGPAALDYLALAEVARAAIVHLGTTVVVCPDDSRARADNIVVGPAIAELLGAAHLTGVVDVRPRLHNGALGLWVEQRGQDQRVRFYADAPVVVSIDGRGPVLDRRPASVESNPDDATADIESLAVSSLGIDDELLARSQLHTHDAAGPGDRNVAVDTPEDLIARLVKDRLLT